MAEPLGLVWSAAGTLSRLLQFRNYLGVTVKRKHDSEIVHQIESLASLYQVLWTKQDSLGEEQLIEFDSRRLMDIMTETVVLMQIILAHTRSDLTLRMWLRFNSRTKQISHDLREHESRLRKVISTVGLYIYVLRYYV
jgi:hypothetical protein